MFLPGTRLEPSRAGMNATAEGDILWIVSEAPDSRLPVQLLQKCREHGAVPGAERREPYINRNPQAF